MMATAGAASRLAATAAEDLDREIEAIVRTLEEHGPVDDDELERLVGARLCEIFDRGSGFKRERRLGLWVARRLSTRIEEDTSPAGHTVRLWI